MLTVHYIVGNSNPFPLHQHLETVVRESKDGTAWEIFVAVHAGLVSFAPPSDDVTLVVIKRQ